MPRFSAGSASVSVVPDLTGFHRTLGAELGRVNTNLKVQVDPDLSGFRQQVQAELARISQAGVKIPVTLDINAASLRGLQAKVSATRLKASVDIDVDRARSALVALGKVGAASIGALGSQAAVGGLLAIASAATQAAGALALLPALGVAAAAPIATLAIGAQGLGDAFKAFSKVADESAAAARSNAAAAQAAAKQHEAAQKAVAAAGRQVTAAERQVQDAQRNSRRAQEELTRAREEAADRLEDLNLQLRASALDEEAAVLQAERAWERLNEATAVGSEATALERREADLAYRQSLQSLEEIRHSNARLSEETAAANAAGVEGSEQVRDAQQRVADAARSEADAQQGLRLAHEQLAEAIDDLGSISVAAAAQTDTLGKAMANLSPIAQQFVNQIHDLAPAWQALRFDVQDRLLRGLGDSITELATRQLPVLRDGLGGLADVMNRAARESVGVFAQPAAARDFAATLGNIRAAMAGAAAGAGPLSQAFIDMATVGSTFLPEMGEALGGMSQRFAEWVASARETGELEEIIQRALDLFGQLGTILGNVGSALGSVFDAGAATGGGLLAVLGELTGQAAAFFDSTEGQGALQEFFAAAMEAARAVMPVIASVAGIFLGQLLPALLQIGAAVAPIATVLLDALSQGFASLEPLLPLIAQAIGAVVAAVLPLLPIVADLIRLLLPPLVSLFQAVAPILSLVAQAIGRALVSALSGVLPLLEQVAQMLLPVLLEVIRQLEPILPLLVAAFLDIVVALLPLIPPLTQIALALLPVLVDIVRTLIPVIVSVVQTIAPWVTQLAQDLIPTVERAGGVFRWLADTISWAWFNLIKPTFDLLYAVTVDTAGTMSSAFHTAMDGVASAWQRLKAIVAAPVNFVVRTVLRDGLFSAWNWVLDKLGVESWKIDLSSGWLQGIPGYATGGLIRGPWLGPDADNVLARLNPREFVQPVHAVDRYGVDFMEAVRTGRFPIEIARGYLPGLATGGQIATAMRKQFPDARTTSMYRPGDPGYHGRRMAVDFAGPTPAPNGSRYMADMKAWWAETYGKGTAELIYNGIGNRVANLKNGSPLAYSAAVQAAHRNHVHVAVAGSLLAALGKVISASGAVSRPWYQDLWDSVTGAYQWLTGSTSRISELGGSPLAGWLKELPGTLVDGMWDNISGPIGDLFGGGDETGGVLVRDSGGFIPPGMSTVYNGTGRPEMVLTGPQWDTIVRMAGAAGTQQPGMVGAVITGTLDLGDGLEGRIDGRIVDVLTSATDRGRYNP